MNIDVIPESNKKLPSLSSTYITVKESEKDKIFGKIPNYLTKTNNLIQFILVNDAYIEQRTHSDLVSNDAEIK